MIFGMTRTNSQSSTVYLKPTIVSIFHKTSRHFITNKTKCVATEVCRFTGRGFATCVVSRASAIIKKAIEIVNTEGAPQIIHANTSYTRFTIADGQCSTTIRGNQTIEHTGMRDCAFRLCFYLLACCLSDQELGNRAEKLERKQLCTATTSLRWPSIASVMRLDHRLWKKGEVDSGGAERVGQILVASR